LGPYGGTGPYETSGSLIFLTKRKIVPFQGECELYFLGQLKITQEKLISSYYDIIINQ